MSATGQGSGQGHKRCPEPRPFKIYDHIRLQPSGQLPNLSQDLQIGHFFDIMAVGLPLAYGHKSGAAQQMVLADQGLPDVVVANAGTGAAAPLHLMTLDDWNGVMATNLTGAFLTVKHAASHLARSGRGSIVAISSIAAPLTHRYMTSYCVSKAGVEMLVRQAADELGVSGIRANAVRPGLVPTDISVGLTANEAIVADYMDQMPVGRLGTTDDIAAAVRFLLGPESGWITGQCIGVDGGHTLRRGPNLTPLMEAVLGPNAHPGGN